SFGRPGLPGRRPRTRLPEGHGPGELRRRGRRSGPGGFSSPCTLRGHPAGAGVQPCDRPGDRTREGDAPRRDRALQPVRAWRQGRAYRRRAQDNPRINPRGNTVSEETSNTQDQAQAQAQNSAPEGGRIDPAFFTCVNEYLELTNRQAKQQGLKRISMASLYAASRFNAHVYMA